MLSALCDAGGRTILPAKAMKVLRDNQDGQSRQSPTAGDPLESADSPQSHKLDKNAVITPAVDLTQSRSNSSPKPILNSDRISISKYCGARPSNDWSIQAWIWLV